MHVHDCKGVPYVIHVYGHNAELLVEVHCTVHATILQSSYLISCTDMCSLIGFKRDIW